MKNNLPLVSFITPTYNRKELLEKAILSVIHQKQNIPFEREMIIVDDWSKDWTEFFIQKYLDKYQDNIKYFYQENGGVGKARNLWLDNMSKNSDYLIFLDSDDELIDDCIYTCLKKRQELRERWEYENIVWLFYFCKTQYGKLIWTKNILWWKKEIYITYHDFLQNKIKFEFWILCKSIYFLENTTFRFPEDVITETILSSKMHKYFNEHWLKCIIMDYIGRIYTIWHWIQITKTISPERFKKNAIGNERILEIIQNDLLLFWYKNSYWEYLFRAWINWFLYGDRIKWINYLKKSLKYQKNIRNVVIYLLSLLNRNIVLFIYKLYI